MTKRRKQQGKRQKSRDEQAEVHDDKRWKRAWAQYRDSLQELFDIINERIRAIGEDAPHPVGPDYKRKKRQKNSN
jgi:hypothetical protein